MPRKDGDGFRGGKCAGYSIPRLGFCQRSAVRFWGAALPANQRRRSRTRPTAEQSRATVEGSGTIPFIPAPSTAFPPAVGTPLYNADGSPSPPASIAPPSAESCARAVVKAAATNIAASERMIFFMFRSRYWVRLRLREMRAGRELPARKTKLRKRQLPRTTAMGGGVEHTLTGHNG